MGEGLSFGVRSMACCQLLIVYSQLEEEIAKANLHIHNLSQTLSPGQ